MGGGGTKLVLYYIMYKSAILKNGNNFLHGRCEKLMTDVISYSEKDFRNLTFA